jgi:hypothetical protein
MARSLSGGISAVATAILRFLMNGCVSVAPALGVTMPPDDHSEQGLTGPVAHVDLPHPISLSPAELRQWESLTRQLR